ncbi:MAG TPA: hypothetical protein VMV18_01830, partial [bacterium]|nr:hypothetical protein [bacterium]
MSSILSKLDGKRALTGVLFVVFALLASGCPASPKLFRTGVAGTVVADSSSRAAALATVYLADSTGTRIPGTETRTNQAGKFRIATAA